MKAREVVMVPILLGMVCGCDAMTSGTVRDRAQDDARGYARRFHPAWTTPVVDCQGVDSDGDGYVRCTVGDGVSITEPIECRTSLMTNYQRGCVPMRLLPGGGVR